jgi:hypothetical protein
MRYDYAFLIAIALITLPHSCLAQKPTITILVTLSSGVKEFGSGFLFDANGDALTCYHVVEGATKIQVFYGNQVYEAKATAISPERDLARLKLLNVALPTKFMPLRMSVPQNLKQQNLTVVGFALGLFDQTVPAKAMQDGFANSQQMKGVKFEPLFATPDVPILPVDVPLQKGMSGSPLIGPDGSVLGIISGSLQPGGSLSWAIGSQNATSAYLHAVDAPRPGYSWPPLSLMKAGGDTLRSQTGVGEDVVDAINNLATSVKEFSEQASTMCGDFPLEITRANEILALFESHSFDSISLADIEKVPGGLAFERDFNERWTTLNSMTALTFSKLEPMKSAQERAKQKQSIATTVVYGYMHSLPQTSHNARISVTMNFKLAQLAGRLHQDTQDVSKAFASAGSPSPITTIADVHKNAIIFHDYLVISRNYTCSNIPYETDLLRQSADIYRVVLDGDPLSAK